MDQNIIRAAVMAAPINPLTLIAYGFNPKFDQIISEGATSNHLSVIR